MYLPRSSKWSMTRRRKRPNFFAFIVLGLVLLFGYYFNQVYLPSKPNPFEATPTVTRSPEALVTEAEGLFKGGKLLQSIDAYQAALNASPQNSTLYIAMARVQVWAGKYEEAQANAENAILLNPENSMAHAVRAWALDFQGKNSDAITEIDKALELDPNNAIAHAYRVEILIDSGSSENIVKAIDVSNNALALDPNAIETRRARAYLLEVTGNYEQAIPFYKSAIEINPNIPILHMELGRNLRFLQVYDDAINEFTFANTLNPSDPEPDLFISRTYATEGDYAKALQYAETAVNDRPTDPSLRGNYGVMYYYNFLYTEAAEQLSLAVNGGQTKDGFPIKGLPLKNETRIVEYFYTYGLALARTNQCGKALQVAQDIQANVHMDDAAMENVNTATGKIIEICQENLDNPAVDTPTSTEETPVETSPAVETATPAPVETSAP
ncbi:MAG TPA: tetratricopeptide repeat protein [Anaerolineales bacterium]|nr:tetratricopeptide repeat protein [Anaerolineales bacterium]